MNQEVENSKNEVALRRFAAVSFIEQKLREGFGILAALRLAALRPWPDENGHYYAARPKAEPMKALSVKLRPKSVNGSSAK